MVVPNQGDVQPEISEVASPHCLGASPGGTAGVALLGISGRQVVRDLGVLIDIF